MSEQFIGEIRPFCGAYAPEGWELCLGQTLPADGKYMKLYTLIAHRFGGDGTESFKLPDLRGRVAMGQGSGAGLSPREVGQAMGTETRKLAINEIEHTHALVASMDTNLVESPLANVLGTLPGSSKEKLFRGDTEHSAALGDSAVGKVGSSRPHSNLMPSLSVNYIIAYDGDYPTLD